MLIPLDALATIVIFLIGLPAILMETLSPEIRQVVLQRPRQLMVSTLTPLVCVIGLAALGTWETYRIVGATATPEDAGTSLAIDQLWMCLLGLMLLIAGGTTFVLSARWKRGSVVGNLVNQAVRHVEQHGKVDESELAELIWLGRHSEPGQEKGLVIVGLNRLAKIVQQHSQYDGARLEDLLVGIEETLVSGIRQGSSRNFDNAVTLLMAVVRGGSRQQHADDLKIAIQTAAVIARATLDTGNHQVQNRCIEILGLAAAINDGETTPFASWSSQALFEIGSDALDKQQLLIAMSALSKLDALVSSLQLDDPSMQQKTTFDILGLVAHFWQYGSAARDFVSPIVEELRELHNGQWPEFRQRCQDYFCRIARLRTAEYVSAID